ncbi:unnamed protein product, partial [Polarella glacialis]
MLGCRSSLTLFVGGARRSSPSWHSKGGRRRCAASAAAQLVDIGANMLDPMFQGEYREKARHPADLHAVLCRAFEAGISKIVVTAGSLQESRDALALCKLAADTPGTQWPQL